MTTCNLLSQWCRLLWNSCILIGGWCKIKENQKIIGYSFVLIILDFFTCCLEEKTLCVCTFRTRNWTNVVEKYLWKHNTFLSKVIGFATKSAFFIEKKINVYFIYTLWTELLLRPTLLNQNIKGTYDVAFFMSFFIHFWRPIWTKSHVEILNAHYKPLLLLSNVLLNSWR